MTMRELLDTLKTATPEEIKELSEVIWNLPIGSGFGVCITASTIDQSITGVPSITFDPSATNDDECDTPTIIDGATP